MRSLKDLTPGDVQRTLAVMKQMLHEVHPQAELNRGPIHDLVLYYAAAYSTAAQQDLADAMRAINLGRLAQDPNAAPPDMVDRILSNWKVKRKPGAKSSGAITVVLEGPYSMVLPAGITMTANGHKFTTKETYTIRTAIGGGVMLPTDRALTKRAGGWTFTIPAVSTTVGLTSNIRRGTALQFDAGTYRNIHNIYAAQDFSGGADEESNAEMLQRLNRSASGKVWSNRCTGEALLCGVPALERAAGVSIIGFGDPEMLRDRHSFWPGSMGGRVDVYVKPLGGLLTKEITVRGRAIDGTPEGARWELYIPRDTAPGFLYAKGVHRIGGGACSITNDARGFELPPTLNKIDIGNPTEATYSAYQTATLTVLEVGTAHKHDSAFVVNLVYLPGIEEAQRIVTSRDVASLAGDVLVKAAIPCLTTIEIEIQRQLTDPPVRADTIKDAVASLINSLGFVGRLTTLSFNNAVTPFLDGSAVVRGVKMSGKIRYPNGAFKTLHATNVLNIPNEPRDLVSPRTTAFFQDAADVHVRVVTADEEV